jgi:hypothetical protein
MFEVADPGCHRQQIISRDSVRRCVKLAGEVLPARHHPKRKLLEKQKKARSG